MDEEPLVNALKGPCQASFGQNMDRIVRMQNVQDCTKKKTPLLDGNTFSNGVTYFDVRPHSRCCGGLNDPTEIVPKRSVIAKERPKH
jgi:hypothetical protein